MQAFWFGIIAILWAGFFMLEGFDFGVGLLTPLLAGNEAERGQSLRSIGPFWDGNEVWLLTAGGASFAAFPEWYASVFSGFYLAFALLLVGLIVRAIGLEYRGKVATAQGRLWCDGAVAVGSLLPAILLGVAFANFNRGVALNSAHQMTGNFFSLLSPYALLGGVTTLLLFSLHGANFLTLRVDGPVAAKAEQWTKLLSIATVVVGAAFLLWSASYRHTLVSILLSIVIAVILIGSIAMAQLGRNGFAFITTALATLLVPIWAFASLWPNMLPASNNAAYSLTIHNASSTHYTLTVMTVVALIFTPIVLIYQSWTYWIFRARVTGEGVAATEQLLESARTSARQVLGGTSTS